MPEYFQDEHVARLSEILSTERAATVEQLTSLLDQELERILEERFTEIARQVGAELEAVLRRAGAAAEQAAQAPPPETEPWPENAPPAEEQRLHLEAQRFARVKVAEMRLYQAEAVVRGRQQGNLYDELRASIDTARETFRQDYVSACPSMRDYLHGELVRTLAQDDAARLGLLYPGPLV